MSCLNRGGHGVFREDVDEAGAVLGGAILTDLPLAFQAFDGDLNAGDGAEEIVDVFGRGVADGESLRGTAARSIDLVQAHGVFVTLDFLTSCSYFREIERVIAPGGHAVFDVMTEDCFDEAAIDAWLGTRLRYPSLHSRDYVIRYFTSRGFVVVDEFTLPLLVHGTSRYLVLRWPGGEQ